MPPMTKKYDKSEVNYRNGDHCGMCKYFSEDDDGTDEVDEGEEEGWCQLVKGPIGEDKLCDEFKPMAGGEPKDNDVGGE